MKVYLILILVVLIVTLVFFFICFFTPHILDQANSQIDDFLGQDKTLPNEIKRRLGQITMTPIKNQPMQQIHQYSIEPCLENRVVLVSVPNTNPNHNVSLDTIPLSNVLFKSEKRTIFTTCLVPSSTSHLLEIKKEVIARGVQPKEEFSIFVASAR